MAAENGSEILMDQCKSSILRKFTQGGSEWLNLVEIIDTITTNKSQSIMKKKNQIKPFKIIKRLDWFVFKNLMIKLNFLKI